MLLQVICMLDLGGLSYGPTHDAPRKVLLGVKSGTGSEVYRMGPL